MFSQEIVKPKVEVDSLYREDQFYFNISYNSLVNKPSGFGQNKFSTGLSIGFLRDMPFNKKRTWAVALGFGYGLSILNHNLLSGEIPNINDADSYKYISGNLDFDKNKHALHFVEFPLEIRWRNSTPDSHKFWRIYTGFKVSYLFFDRYKFSNASQETLTFSNPDLNKIQYGVYTTFGFNTFNFYVYYGLNPIFKTGQINNENIKFSPLNFGLQFYIL